MKSTMFSAATTLVLAAIACGAPLTVRDSSVTITVKTGDGDSASTVGVPLDQLTTTSGPARAGVKASISDAGVFCQAFTDAAGTEALGPIFSAGNDASYSETSDGGVGSDPNDAVPIGSFLCSNSEAGVSGNGSNDNGGNNGGDNSGSSGTVRVQLERDSDEFVQTEIPLNTLVATASTVLRTQGLDLSLVSADGADLSAISCQVFADAAGTTTVGNPATADTDAILSANNTPVTIGSIKCDVTA